MEDYRIDSHKLMFHVSRVNQWLAGKDIYPIYIEIGPSGACNHRCSFCALDYLDYKPQFIDKKVLMDILAEASKCGVKSVMFAGEGEPLLHKDIAEIILYAKKLKIDVALTTNAVYFNRDIAKRCLPLLTWIRVSVNAGTSKTYAKIHRCNQEDFQMVLNNIANAVKIKKQNHYFTTIGAQLLLIPDNYREVTILARRLKDIKVDYLIVKPYSQHPLSKNRIGETLDYSDYLYFVNELQMLSNNNFKVIFRGHTIEKLKEGKPYKHCLGLPFWAYIDAGGGLYACSAFLGDKRFCYGNIYKNSFREIWKGARRKQVLDMFATKLDVAQCRQICRLDEINRYLWELKYPPEHVNFI